MYKYLRNCLDCKKPVKYLSFLRCLNCYRKYKQSLLPTITCGCGCGEIIPSRNMSGEPKKFIRGHQKRGKLHHNWKGGKRIHECGYIMVYKPDHPKSNKDKLVMEHRLVYEEYHNVCLLPWTEIHHIDKNESNNIIENLQPMFKAEHTSIHSRGRKVSLETRLKQSIIRRKDMSNRICCICGTDKTYIDKRNRPCWFKHKGGFMCGNCRQKIRKVLKSTQ